MREDARLVYQIGRLRKVLRHRFEEQAVGQEITAPQFLVLRRLWEQDGLLTCALMRDVASDAGTITGMLDRLEAKGLIRRARSAEDRRAVRVFLTPAGRGLEQPLLDLVQGIAEQALRGFGAEERAWLMDALDRVGGNVGA